jgi:hypothetical protein
MSIPTTTMFSDLISRFPTSDDLFAFLRSAEGGSLTIRTDKMTPDHPFAIIHYDKEKSDMTLSHVGNFRSVVWNVNTNRPVCMSPVRGRKFSAAIDAAVDVANSYIEDFVDGVMINMFHDGRDWTLTTRTQLGAEGHFYGTRTFRELFWETFTTANLSKATDLKPGYTYSWVLQHPEERIVVAPEYGIPRLYLVEIRRTDTMALADEDSQTAAMRAMRPQDHADLHTLEDVSERVAAWGKRFGAKWQGLVIYSGDKRYKIRSNEYEEARHLRGNQAKRPFTWLERWGENKLGQYLRLYPEERVEAEALVARFKACTQELYDLYQKVYRQRAFPLREAPQKYRKLLWDCHAANAGAYFPNTRTFMNQQDTARKLWLCNYEVRYGVAPAAPEPLDPAVWPPLGANI